MEWKVLCPRLEPMLRKTILALCEVNISYQQKLEISGSIHIRSDGEKVLTCLIDEETTPTFIRQSDTVASSGHKRKMEETAGVPNQTGDADVPLVLPPGDKRQRHIINKFGISARSVKGIAQVPRKPEVLKLSCYEGDGTERRLFDPSSADNATVKQTDVDEATIEQCDLTEAQTSCPLSSSDQVERRPKLCTSTSLPGIKIFSENRPQFSVDSVPEGHDLGQSLVLTGLGTSPHLRPSPFSGDPVDVSSSSRNSYRSETESPGSEAKLETAEDLTVIKMEPDSPATSSDVSSPFPSHAQVAPPSRIPGTLDWSNHGPSDIGPMSSTLNSPEWHSHNLSLSQLSPSIRKSRGLQQKFGLQDLNPARRKGKKKWQCVLCGLTLSSKFYLNSHVNAVHTRSRIYPCEYCGKLFYSHGASRIHKLRNHWVEKRHKCTQCGQLFVLPFELRAHIAKKHKN